MKDTGWFSRLLREQLFPASVRRMAGCIAVVILATMVGAAAAQNPAPGTPAPAPEGQVAAPPGYSIHQSIDAGGHMVGLTGSNAMYDTMVNLQSGPRILGQTFQLHALPGNKHTWLDDLNAFSTGFGGDPNDVARLDASKGKLYEFSGLFRRDRQYFDYDLLGNPNIPGGQTTPIGPTKSPTGALVWPQDTQSPFLFNTVRRMTDTHLTLLPLSTVSFRLGYSQNIFQGPSITPSGYQVAGSYSVLVEEFQRNSADDFLAAVDWKPAPETKVSLEEQLDHYKMDSYFMADPSTFNVQEADGTPVALLANYYNLTPYSSSACTSTSMGGNPVLSAPNLPGGMPVVNPACAVLVSYVRLQPTRMIYPTEVLRLQSSSIRNVAINGNARYTYGKMSLPNYYDAFQGLSGTTREQIYTASGSAKRKVAAADFGAVWQATQAFSLADQFDFSNVQQPGSTTMLEALTTATPKDTSTSTGNETINNTNLTTTGAVQGASTFEGSGTIGTPLPDFLGQKFITNNATATWNVTGRTTFSLTYRYQMHSFAEGTPHVGALAPGATSNGTVTIHENGGIFNAALRPANHWDINGTVEIAYYDNVITPVAPRQFQQYRLHTMYRPRPWATLSGAFNDRERHDNTNNNQASVAAGTVYAGPLEHQDHSRFVSLGADLEPNEHYGVNFFYAYSDVYTATNICYDAAASAAYPGASPGPVATLCPGATVRGTNYYEVGPVKDFMNAPTQSGSVALMMSPVAKFHSNIGYRVNAVNGNQFFNDPRGVNGALNSTYESPFFNVAWTVHPGLIWKAEYNFYGYGEGGPSGSPYCLTSNPTTAAPNVAAVSCSSVPGTGLTLPSSGDTAARNYHANIVTLGMHYEF